MPYTVMAADDTTVEATPEIQQLLKQADLYIEQSNYQHALELLIQAYQASNTLDNDEINNDILSAMANAYYNTGQLEQAHRYYSDLVKLDTANNDKQALSISLFNLGHVNASLKKYQEADENFQRSLTLSRELSDESGIAYTLKAMGVNAQAQSRVTTAKRYLEQALNSFEKISDIKQTARVHRHLGDIAEQQQQYKKALIHYKLAQADLNDEPFSKALMRTHRGLSNVYEKLENYQQSLNHHQRYTELLEQQLTHQSKEATKRLQVQFETQRFATENDRLGLLNQSQETELQHRQAVLQMQYLAIALAASIIFLFMVLWSRSRHHAYNMQLLATTDDLTGLQNRRAILQAGNEEWQRSIRFKRAFCCLLLDIDHFKLINDTYGHAVGDDILRAFADAVNDTLRQTDLVGRFGGEEFLIIASETTSKQALILAKRVMKKIEAIQHEAIINKAITVSIGIAEFKNERSLEDLIAHSDEALYTAKDNGRNQAIIYQS